MRRTISRALLAASATAVAFGALAPSSALADATQSGGPSVVLNPGGGMNADGSDGLVLVVNGMEALGNGGSTPDGDTLEVPTTGSDQIFFGATPQWCCTGAGPALSIGGVLYGNGGAGDYLDSVSWDSVTLLGTSGAAIQVANGDDTAWTSTSTGDATATVRYEVTVGGLLYRVDRAITYVYPNPYYDEVWTITIPDGNQQTVKFYHGGDASPGGSDDGVGEARTNGGLTSYYGKEPNSDFYVAFMETSLNSLFDGLWLDEYDVVYDTLMNTGLDLGFVINTTVPPPDDEGYIDGFDIGLDMQWTIPTTAGTYTRQMRTEVGFVSVLEGSLPTTGSSSAPALTALVLVLMGAAAVTVAKRSRIAA